MKYLARGARCSTFVAAMLLAGCDTMPPAATAPWTALFDGHSLTGLAVTSFGGEGEVAVHDGALWLDFGSPLTGVNSIATLPRCDYELEVTAARIAGNDFFVGLTFPVGDQHLTLVLGGWGGSVCGLSSLDGADASRNETRTLFGFETERDYTARVIVERETVRVLLDGAAFFTADLRERALSLRPEVEPSRPLGITSFSTRSRIRTFRWRPLVAASR